MTGRRTPCLALALFFLFLYASSKFVFSPPTSSRSLAEDALRAAYRSVYQTTWSLFEDINTMPRRSAKIERLQKSLDDLHRRPSPDDMHRLDICASLAGKRVTMIGGEHVYQLHVLLLRHRERVEAKPFPCPYHEFCTHHHICLSPSYHFRGDMPPSRYVKSPTAQELIDTESAAINYLVSDSLCSAQNASSWEYTLPFVDSATGVRLRETYWLPAARKANVVVLGRGPLSAPGQSYTGNWSFLRDIPDYVGASLPTSISGKHGTHDRIWYASEMVITPRSLDILNAAVHLTVSRFLPDLFQLLRSNKGELRPSKRKQLIWPSSWYRLPNRGAAKTVLLRSRVRLSNVRDTVQYFTRRRYQPVEEHVLSFHLTAMLDADAMDTTHLEDPWTLLFNAQVYLQNAVLRELLPRYGIAFLPLDRLWSESGQARRHGHSSATVDAERTVALEEAFLTKMDYILRYME